MEKKTTYYMVFKDWWQGLNWTQRSNIAAYADSRHASEEFLWARSEWLQNHPLEHFPPNMQKEVFEMRRSAQGKDLYYRSRVEDEIQQFIAECNEERFLAWLNAPKEQDMDLWDYKKGGYAPSLPQAVCARKSKIHGFYD